MFGRLLCPIALESLESEAQSKSVYCQQQLSILDMTPGLTGLIEADLGFSTSYASHMLQRCKTHMQTNSSPMV